MITFEIGIRMNTRELLPGVKSVEDEINGTMHSFGFSENMRITNVLPLQMTVGRHPTPEEMKSLLEIVIKEFQDKFGPATIEYTKAI